MSAEKSEQVIEWWRTRAQSHRAAAKRTKTPEARRILQRLAEKAEELCNKEG